LKRVTSCALRLMKTKRKCTKRTITAVPAYYKYYFRLSVVYPKYRWEDNIKQDICQTKIKNWIACVQDRGKWKYKVVQI